MSNSGKNEARERMLWKQYSDSLHANKNLNCLDPNELGAFLENRLSAAEEDRVYDHVRVCKICLNSINSLREALKAPPEIVPEALRSRLIAAIDRAIVRPENRYFALKSALKWVAVVLLLLTVGYGGLNFGIATFSYQDHSFGLIKGHPASTQGNTYEPMLKAVPAIYEQEN